MRAVTFQAPGEVRVDEGPEPEPLAADDAIVRVEATGICGSDLHIYHGRVKIEPGFVIGHEFVGDGHGGGRRRSRAWPSATACWAASTPPAGRASSACAATTTSATRRACSATARRSDRSRARRRSRCSCRTPTSRCDACPTAMSRRRRAVRRRRDGHRLPRGRGGGHASRATPSRCSASGRSACAPCRSRRRPARRSVIAVDPVAERLEIAALSAPTPSTYGGGPRAAPSSERPTAAARTSWSTRSAIPTRSTLAARMTRKAGTVSVIGVYAERVRGAHGHRVDQGAHARDRPART